MVSLLIKIRTYSILYIKSTEHVEYTVFPGIECTSQAHAKYQHGCFFSPVFFKVQVQNIAFL